MTVAALAAAFATVVVLALRPAAASDAHAPDPHAAAAPPPPPAKPEPPPPPPPRPPPLDVRPPIAGPIAGERPKFRETWLTDPATGFALGGWDPVSYFFGGEPRRGDAEWQYDWGGTTWLFADEGDLAAFREAPETYAPMFGGRCAFAIARGLPAEGSPGVSLIWRGRLLFFADPTSRVAFLTDPDRLFADAVRRWPEIAARLP